MYHASQENSITCNGISITYGTVVTPQPPQPHDHDFDEIVIVLGGSAIQYINSEKYNVTTGDVYIIKGESIHYFLNQNNFNVFNIGFQPWMLNDFSHLITKTPGYAALFNAEPAYRKQSHFSHHLHLDFTRLHTLLGLLESLKKEMKASSNDLIVTALFMQITAFLCRSYQETIRQTTNHNPYAHIIEYVDNNFKSNITLDDLSHHSGLSKNGIIAIFKRLYKTTPIKYINTLRVYHAEQLLKTTDMSITQVAMECGFNDSNYFTRTFKSIKGITPREFKSLSRSLF